MRYGHFDGDAAEYVVDRPDLPASWTNYLGRENWCAVLNQSAGGYAFYRSSESGRVTRFRPNGVPKDFPGHYVYLRDDDSGDYWSVSWQPVGKPLEAGTWTARHGLSYSVYEGKYAGVAARQTVFVPLGDDLEIWDVEITNDSGRPRALSCFGYCEFSFHSVRIDNQNFQMSLYAAGSSFADGVIEYDFFYEPWTYHYFTSTAVPASFDCLRDSFIGPWRTEANPLAVERGRGSGSAATTGNHCGALHHSFTLAPGETVRLAYLLGYGRREAGAAARAKFGDPCARDAALAALKAHWDNKRSLLVPSTPSPAFDTLIGTWNLYQAETCVTWSRFASFVEVGGRVGLGYRDTAQDVLSVVHTNPAKTRQRLLELLHGQMSQGYGLHLFEPADFADSEDDHDVPEGVKFPTVVPDQGSRMLHGLKDVCSDDHLWLIPSLVEWVKETGWLGFFDQVVPFADSFTPPARRAEVLGSAADRFPPEPATVFEHLLRAVRFTAEQVGAHGVALGLRADWNDCLNLGGGETALVTFLHVWAVRALLEAARALVAWDGRDLAGVIAELEAMAALAGETAEAELWDGEWYLRGYTRDGVKIGSRESEEGQIFLEHMAWPVIAGIASEERARLALDAVHTRLASPFGLHLNQPSYTKVDDAIGFVTRVYPGVKENGAIFSHPNAWPIIAETVLGRGDRAFEYWDALQPYRLNDLAEVRRAEPYVYAQFVYGRDHEYYGRAENPWLTGSSGWMYTAATRHILGLRPGFSGLVVDPCIPSSWPGFRAERVWRGHRYLIEVQNPGAVNCGVKSAVVDGVELAPVPDPARPEGGRLVALIPLPPGAPVWPGGEVAPVPRDNPALNHAVEITLG